MSKQPVIVLGAPWWRCENGNEFRSGQSKPKRCPVCGSTKIEAVVDVDAQLSTKPRGGNHDL